MSFCSCSSLLLLVIFSTFLMLLAVFALPALLTLFLLLFGSFIGRSGAALLSLLLHLCSTLFAALLCYEALIAQLPSLLFLLSSCTCCSCGGGWPRYKSLLLASTALCLPALLYALTAALLYCPPQCFLFCSSSLYALPHGLLFLPIRSFTLP